MSGYTQDKCCHPGCNNLQVTMGPNYNYSGLPGYRKWCQTHYNQRKANNAGFKTITEYANNLSPYRKHRKDYCENKDGRLGYKCRHKVRHSAQLQVDHIDGNPYNHNISNLQTLCANCHIYKTHAKKDYATPGRKTLKEVE